MKYPSIKDDRISDLSTQVYVKLRGLPIHCPDTDHREEAQKYWDKYVELREQYRFDQENEELKEQMIELLEKVRYKCDLAYRGEYGTTSAKKIFGWK